MAELDPPLNERIASIILAGGQGTRLYPLTQHRCKPSVCFAGKYRLIDIPISNSLNSHIHRIFVISQHFASDLQQHLSNAYPHSFLHQENLEMLCPEEGPDGVNWFLGTADAVRKNIHHLQKYPVDYFLILSGDQLYYMNLLKMVEFAKEHNADLVVASLLVQEKEARRMGLLKIAPNQQIIDFCEKPQEPDLLEKFCFAHEEESKYLGSMGIYVFKKEALIRLLREEGNDFGKELIPKKIQENNSFAFIYDGYWEDIGTVASYYQANLALTEQKECLDLYSLWNPLYTAPLYLPSPLIKGTRIEQSIISEGCVIEAKEISHSLIGSRVHIGRGTEIHDSILMGHHQEIALGEKIPVTIGDHCTIKKAIIDEDAFIGNHVVLTNQKQLMHYDGDGLFIRDGIIIVPSGVRVPNHFIL